MVELLWSTLIKKWKGRGRDPVSTLVSTISRDLYSTEIALLAFNVISSMDKGKITALIFLGLSVAFDTISYDILLFHLKHWFDLSCPAVG